MTLRFLSLIIITVLLAACNNLWTPNDASSVDYRIYHQLINDAEMALLDSSYTLADHSFKAAFAYVPRGFKHDYLLAGINAQRLGNTEQAFVWLDSAALLGLTAETWELDTAIYLLQEQPEWQDFLKRHDRLHEIYQSKLHPAVVKTVAWLDSLELAYQDAHGTEQEIDYKWFYQTNHDSLVSLINRYGWPGITLAGDNTLTRRRQWFVIQHRSMADFQSLEGVYRQAIINGEMYPYQYAWAYDVKFTSDTVEQAFTAYMQTDRTEPFDPPQVQWFGAIAYTPSSDYGIVGGISEGNKRRREWGLEPVEDYHRKRAN